MKITTIKYEQLFPTGLYANQRLGVEIQLEDGDIDKSVATSYAELVHEYFAYAKETVEAAFHSMNPNVGEVHTVQYGNAFGYGTWGNGDSPQAGTVPLTLSDNNRDPKEARINAIIATIQSYNNKENLEKNLATMVERMNNPRISQAYNETMEKLTK